MAELNEYQRDKIIRTALGEARGQGVEGMADVIQVFFNRANSGLYPSDPAEVATQRNRQAGKYEFSAWNEPADGGNNPEQFKPSDPIYKQGAQALDAVLSGNRPDYTGGSLFYKTPDAVSPFHDRQDKFGVVERNGHVFYPTRPMSQETAAQAATAAGSGGQPAPDIQIRDMTAASQFNFGDLQNPNALVIHHTGGSGTNRPSVNGVIQTFKDRNFPAHFVIDRDGTIIRTLPENARGQHTRPSERAGLDISNANSWGVEMIALDDKDVTPAQTAAAVQLTQYLNRSYGLPTDRVVGHGYINGHKQTDEGQQAVLALREAGLPVAAYAAALPRLPTPNVATRRPNEPFTGAALRAKEAAGPVPPGEIPNVVASQTDTTPQTRDVPRPRPRPQQRPDIMQALTPKMIPQGVNYPFLPQMTNTSVTRGFGSLTPNAVQETMPSQIPQSAMLANSRTAPPSAPRSAQYEYAPNGRPRDPDNGFLMDKSDPRYREAAAGSPVDSVRQSANTTANVPPLPRPRPGMPVVPYERQYPTTAQIRADTGQDQRRAELAKVARTPYGQGTRVASIPTSGVGQPPATRSVPSVPVPASPAMGITADRGAMPTRSAFLSEFGLANPRETLAAPLPTTAVPGPRRVGSNERLGPGIPVASATASGLGQLFPPTPYYDVSTALDVVPDAVPRMPIGPGLPPPPIPRPLRTGVNVQMPTQMGQRPSLPMPRANPFAMPTPVAQRPNPNALRVTVNGAGSYNAPQRAPTPTREQMLAAIRARSRGPTAFGHGGTIDGAVQPIGTLSGRR